MDIFDKRILDSLSSSRIQCFRIRPRLQQSFPQGLQSIYTGIIVHGAQPIMILFSMYSFFLFLARGRGNRSVEKPSFSALLLYFFPNMVYCHVLFHTGFCSAARNWREWYKNLTVLSYLDAYKYIEPDSI